MVDHEFSIILKAPRVLMPRCRHQSLIYDMKLAIKFTSLKKVGHDRLQKVQSAY